MYMYVEFWSIIALGMLNTSGMPYGAGVVGMGVSMLTMRRQIVGSVWSNTSALGIEYFR